MTRRAIPTALALAAAAALLPAHAAYEPIPSSGSPVLIKCQGVQEPEPDPNPPAPGTCQVNTLPGTGWTQLRANNNGQILANGSVIGTYSDRVWRRNGSNEYVFGMRLNMNTNTWTPPAGQCPDTTPTYFEVNDMFRAGFSGISNVRVAYKLPDNAEEGAWVAGRTRQGVNEYPDSPYGLDPARNNNWVNFRTDVGVADPDGVSRAASAWMLVRFTTTRTVSTTQVANTIRLWQGGEEDQCGFEILLPGYRLN